MSSSVMVRSRSLALSLVLLVLLTGAPSTRSPTFAQALHQHAPGRRALSGLPAFTLQQTPRPTAPPPARGQHLSHDALMSLSPSPNVRPLLDSNYQYLSGGIGIMIYDGVNAMDVLGPFQVLSSAGLMPFLVSASRDMNSNNGTSYKNTVVANSGLVLTTDRTVANTPRLDVLVATGGALETAMVAADPDVIRWVQSVHQNTHWTSSVCTGAWVLGAAGLLQGKRATANWYRARELLTHFKAIPEPSERYVFDGKIVTAAGVTAGMDMALAMVQRLFDQDLNGGRDFTQAVMLDLQYDPKPPVTGGSPEKTEPHVFEGMEMMYDMIPSYYLNLNMTFAEFVMKTLPI